MLTNEPPASQQRRRRDRIRARVSADGFVSVETLSRELEVSTMTIHRDLDVLQQQGWLRKVRGGATSLPSADYHGDLGHRAAAMTEEKQALARFAARLVQPGQVILVDESTTVGQLVPLLAGTGNLTVVTNGLTAAGTLARAPGIDLVGIGGTYFPAYDAFLGAQAAAAIRSLHVDVAFISTTAIARASCWHLSQEMVQVKQAFLDAADRRVLLADHTKFERRALHRLTALEGFDLVVVDAGTPDSVCRQLADQGVAIQATDGTDPVPPEIGARFGVPSDADPVPPATPEDALPDS
jgi:DeoR/GlpR family transcriptional regulator of sugar metabolism